MIEDEYENEELSIESIIPNHNNSLISVVQNNKVYFFDTSNFKEYAEGLGDCFTNVSICLPYYRSNIVFIVGNKGNVIFPHNKIVIWDLIEKKQLAMIELDILNNDTESIQQVYVNTRALFVILTHKILLFDILTLAYITTFEDINGKKGLVSLKNIKDIELNPEITLAYVSFLNNHNIKIIKIRFLYDKVSWSQQLIATDLQGIQFISISTNLRFIAVVCSLGEKINLYSLRTYKVKKYLRRGHNKVTIADIVFDPSEKFMCLFSLQKTFHFYPLLSKYLESTHHFNNEDEQDYYIYNQPPERKSLLIKLSKRKYKDSHAQYKNEIVLKEQIIYFYLNEKADLIAINKKGKVLIIKMNKKNGGMCTLAQTKMLDTSDM